MRPLDNPRVWLDSGDGWQELTGITRIAINEQHQPIDLAASPGYDPPDPVVDGYGAGEIRGLLELTTRVLTPEERALSILAPHLAREPLYRGV
ncbi:MAG: hypothetical protein HOV73_25935 [Streptomyces sp.]|nr:hypothetical protein [Streptomyces sp.]NUR43527.1 hypothetical protein [Streptomyces sp.]NUS15221.1 hypothetical protein [Streptomyces sp.]NUS25561.1 hypothetical protein [Streptomyces sp.]NUS77348.1 hypothetical protein [Streptomyces sp.]